MFELPPRDEASLRRRQQQGRLRVRLAADWRTLVAAVGLAEAYAETDVVVAADAGFTDQGSLHLHLGPTDPPIRLRDASLGGVAAQAGAGAADLVIPIGGGLAEGSRRGGAQVLAELEQLPAVKTYEQQMLEQAQQQVAMLSTIATNTAATVSAVVTSTVVQQAYFTGLAGVVPGGVATGGGNTGGAAWGGSPVVTPVASSGGQSYASFGPGSIVPAYAGGTPYVPTTGLALMHQGERVITADDNVGLSGALMAIGDKLDAMLRQNSAWGRAELEQLQALVAGSRAGDNARLLASVQEGA